MWVFINRVSDLLFGTWFDLMSGWPDWLQIVLTALPLTVLALLIYRWVSDQAGIVRTKDRIKAYLLELWLYKDDPRVLLAAQGRVVWHSLVYLRHALLPVAILLVPVGLLTAQVESRFALRPPVAGEPVLVSATVATADNLLKQEASLAGPGLAVETLPLRITGTGEVLWRVSSSEPGRRELDVRVGAARDALELLVGVPGRPPLAAETWPADDWRSLAHPSTRALPPAGAAAGTAVAKLAIDYPPARARFAGLSSASWWLLGATLLIGFTIRRWFGVTF
jgi:hypothetical protein